MSFLLVLRIFIPIAIGYFLTSTFRSISAVIAPDLVRDLSLSASELGFSVSMFFVCAAVIQLPYGVLLDRYDPRRLYAGFLLICFLGALIVAFSQDVISLSIGRVFLAAGTTASAVTAYKVFSMWYLPDRLPMANSLALAAGGLGMMVGTAPVEVALQFLDWRQIHLILGILVACGAAFVIIITPFKKTMSTGVTFVKQVRGFSVVLKSFVFWQVTPILMVVMGVYGAFPTLWAGPWLRDVAGFDNMKTANILFLMAGASTTCYFFTSSVISFCKRWGLTTIGVAILTAIIFTAVVIILFLQWASSDFTVALVWILFGFLAPFTMVIYAGLGKEFPLEFTGRLNACLTLSWLFGMVVTQNIYGWALDQFPDKNGNYAIEGHHLGMGIMALFLAAALAWYWIMSLILRYKT